MELQEAVITWQMFALDAFFIIIVYSVHLNYIQPDAETDVS